MAQVKVFGLRRSLEPVRQALSDAIHDSIVNAFAYPPDKRFHRFFCLADADFIYPKDRSERYVIIEISVFEGRSVEAKKNLVRRLYRTIQDRTDIRPQDIEVTIFETPRHAWGIRGLPADELGLNYRVEV